MPAEQYANDLVGGTTLATALTDTTGTTVVVTDATPFPTVPNFRIRIETEIIFVTAVSGPTFTGIRGYEGSSAATHVSGVPVSHILTAGSIIQASVPWSRFPVSPGYTVPILANFTSVNPGSSTATQTDYGISLYDLNTGTMGLRMWEITAPSTPYTITGLFQDSCMLYNSTFLFGLHWRASASSTPVTLILSSSIGQEVPIACQKWSSYTAQSSQYAGSGFNLPCGDWWLRISDDGTNRTSYFSRDGLNFVQTSSVTHTDFITPNRVGFCFAATNATYPLKSNLISWKQT
jgi:hypothetical protein